ncbi:hypothetical protein ABZ897_49920 [Nonomuraea sp. NPDC046802]
MLQVNRAAASRVLREVVGRPEIVTGSSSGGPLLMQPALIRKVVT